jgi:hypothetical protein
MGPDTSLDLVVQAVLGAAALGVMIDGPVRRKRAARLPRSAGIGWLPIVLVGMGTSFISFPVLDDLRIIGLPFAIGETTRLGGHSYLHAMPHAPLSFALNVLFVRELWWRGTVLVVRRRERAAERRR